MTSVTKANFINQNEFEQLIADNKLVVVDYTASWCGPCRMIAPLIDRLAAEYSNSVSVVKIDIEKNQDNAKKYEIKDIPAVLVFRDGEVVEKLLGLQTYENFSNILEVQLKL